MYPYRGGNSYGQPSYTSQSSYGQNTQSAYTGNSVGSDSGSQLNLGSRHPSILSGPREPDIIGYRAHPSASSQYGTPYTSLYGSASLGSGQQQVSALSAKGSGHPALEGRSNYGVLTADSPKYTSTDYVSSTGHGYGHKSEHLIPEKMADYASLERRQYAERQSSYMGRDLPIESRGIYVDPVGYGSQHKSEMYDHLDQATLLRQDQMMKSQALQPASHEGTRQADYLAVRSGTFRQPTEELMPYGGKVDADTHVPAVGASSYAGKPAPSILGAAPQRNVDDLMYARTSSNPGYGVSLPPGRDYGLGKGLHGTSLESDFHGSISSRSGLTRLNELKDERSDRELDLKEDERRRERLREREREKERQRERERERDRERQREREREREKERERDRERKRALERRAERTPPRSSLDRRGSSLSKDAKPLRRDSPRREAVHRIHSPVKEKRREYVCKVYTSCLVDAERDYLSLDKRYPRLYISPDFSKMVMNWSRADLKIPMYTPVSFEHDYIEDGAHQKETSAKESDMDTGISEHRSIVWNAKIVLMSGLSKRAVEDLTSEKISYERIPHVCNFLRFSLLKKDRSFMAIGGPWNPVDGGDPSVDDSSLVRTILRYAKNLTNLDLQNCRHWNRFLEIHYDRIGSDGLFSHKEVTVLFVPDLSDCLPSINAWREQWLAHKKTVAEREKQREMLRNKKDFVKGSSKDRHSEKTSITEKDGDNDIKKDSVKGSSKDGHSEKTSKTEKDVDDKKVVTKVPDEQTGEVKSVEKKEQGADTLVSGSAKPGKKKIVRRIVKQKVAGKKVVGENGSNENTLGEKAAEASKVSTEIKVLKDASSTDTTSVKTSVRKKIAKRDAAVKIETESGEDKSVVKSDVTVTTAVRSTPVKRTVKRKIIKRVPKKKATGGETSGVTADKKTNIDGEDGKTAEGGNGTDVVTDPKDMASKGDNTEKSDSRLQPGVESSQKNDNVEKEGQKTDEQKLSEAKKLSAKDDNEKGKEKANEKDKTKDVKSRKGKDGKDVDTKRIEEPPRPGFILQTKSDKDARLRSISLSLDSMLDYSDKDIEESTFELSVFAESFYEMLQYQMGSRVLKFLQKLRLIFVAKRHRRKRQREQATDNQVTEKAENKRLKNGESPGDDKFTKPQVKDGPDSIVEKSGSKGVGKSTKPEVKDEPHLNVGSSASKGKSVDDQTDKIEDVEMIEEEKTEDEEEMTEEEDPEEEDPDEDSEEDDPEEDEMLEESPHDDSNKESEKKGKTEIDEQWSKQLTPKDENVNGEKKSIGEAEANKLKEVKTETDEQGSGVTKDESGDGEKKAHAEAGASKSKEEKAEASKKRVSAQKEVRVDKELLQAFRFFDRNRAGYLRVEDMRLILHSLGKFLSHRDVKELVQSALLESNTGRDDHILYEKLVRMSLDVK